MTSKYILGIDTSNYKTSVAVIDEEKTIICDVRRFLKVKQGERGLRQSDALFQHVKNMPELIETAMDCFTGQLEAIAYSSSPRPVEGSYMPVFTAGESSAKSLGAALRIPVFAFSHQEGHIEAIRAYSELRDRERFLACHFSGGTSELLQVIDTGTGYEIEIVGGSMDIAFGQVIDRAGVALGMDFPAGEEMDCIALENDMTCETGGKRLTPVKVKDAWLNLSGIDTQMKRQICDLELNKHSGENLADSPDIARRDSLIAELFIRIADAMGNMIIQGAEKTGISDILMAGGVTSSAFIRDRLLKSLMNAGVHAVFDDKGLSQDNAVGTALLGGKMLWR